MDGTSYRLGDPDLQGTWNNARSRRSSARVGRRKELLSKDEEAEVNEQSETRAERRPADRAQDLELAYDQFWWDRGASIGRTSLIVDPKDGRLPPLTPQGQKMLDARAAARQTRGAFDSWIDRPLQERCILYHGVPPLPTAYNNNYEIAQAPGLVAILTRRFHEVRLIPLDGRPHIGASVVNGWRFARIGGTETLARSVTSMFRHERRFSPPNSRANRPTLTDARADVRAPSSGMSRTS